LFEKDRLFPSEWREVLLLLAGVLYDQGEDKLNHLVNAVITRELPNAAEIKYLPQLARAVSLLGGMVNDLRVFAFQPENRQYTPMVQKVMAIFDKDHYQTVLLRIRIEAADTLGRVGDPRFSGDPESLWVKIPGGAFWMGIQKEHPGGQNYDEMAYGDENPVHQVKLSPFWMGKYPVTQGCSVL
jgi:formylglycine-generating enzyme required for sulfatase activity